MTPERPPIYYHFMALLTIVIWSFSFLFIIKLNRELTSTGVVVLRFDIFAIFIAALLLFRRPDIRGHSARDWAIVVMLSLVGGPLYHMIFSWSAGTGSTGDSRIDPALLGLILATVPVHTGWLGWVVLRERVSRLRVVALVLGLAGVATVLAGRHGRIDLLPTEQLEGPIGATVAAMFGAGIAVLLRAARSVFPPLDLVIVGGVMMVAWTSLLHPAADLHQVPNLTTGGWVAAAFLGIFGLGVAFLTWASALSGLPAVTAAMYLFGSSVLAALWGWLFDGHPVGRPFAAGALLVAAGLALNALGSRPAPSVAATPSDVTLPPVP